MLLSKATYSMFTTATIHLEQLGLSALLKGTMVILYGSYLLGLKLANLLAFSHHEIIYNESNTFEIGI